MRLAGRSREALLAGALLALLPLAAGCWDRVEIIDRAFVAAAAVDAAPNGYRLAVQIVLPQSLATPGGDGGGSGGGRPSVALLSAEGRTLAEAAGRLDLQAAGRLFWGQTRLVVVGEALARRGVAGVVDFLVRNRESRLRTDLLVARGTAAPLLSLAPPYRDIPAETLYQELRKGRVPRLYAFEAAIRLREAGRGFLAPAVDVARPGLPRPSPSQGGTPTVAAAAQPVLDGAGVFSGDRLVGWLDAPLAQGALWLSGQGVGSPVTLAYGGQPVTLRIERLGVRSRAVRSGGQALIRLRIDVDDSLEAASGLELPLDRPDSLERLSTALAAEVRHRTLAALAATRRMGADVWDFGHLLAGQQPGLWAGGLARGWPAGLRSLPVDVRVEADIRSPGRLVGSLPPGRGRPAPGG
ncbi:MAG: Ger(x)C family spore germination protein [Firmicutes bacterium]|nr:Ger(x)C family spore germination protein [Bacillota bacterium]